MNWKVRLHNPAWPTGFISFLVATDSQVLSLFDFIPAVPEETWTQFAAMAIQILTLLGVLVDPTTKGLGDSQRAMTYDKPSE